MRIRVSKVLITTIAANSFHAMETFRAVDGAIILLLLVVIVLLKRILSKPSSLKSSSLRQCEPMEGLGNTLESRDNPLMFPEVLEVLFKKLPLKDLQTCRLVCKDWFEVSLPSWWGKATLKFKREEIVTRLKYSTNTTTLSQFLEFCENECTTTPFKKLHISQWTFTDGDENQARFLELVGKHAKSLTLDSCSFESQATFRKIIYQMFPNLMFLQLEVCIVHPSTDNGGVFSRQDYKKPVGEVLTYKEPAFGVHGLNSLVLVECLPDSFIELLSHFHMIESFWMEHMQVHIPELLNAVKVIRSQDRNKLPMKEFDVTCVFTEFHLEPAACFSNLNLIRELNLPLQDVAIDFDSDKSDGEVGPYVVSIMDHLSHYSSTLRSLTGDGNMRGFLKDFPFGIQLDRLKKISVSENFFNNLYFLVHTPNLDNLTIGWSGFNDDEFDPSNNVISNTCEVKLGNWTLSSLRSLHCVVPIGAEDMRKVRKWMPNIVNLEMQLNDEAFANICENWKQLEHLSVLGDELTDQGVTGLRVEAGGAGNVIRNPSNIRKLTSLKSFCGRGCSNLTETSVYEGLLGMASLRSVGLRGRSQMTAVAVAAMETQGIKVEFRLSL